MFGVASHGVSAVEFAFVSPIVVLLLGGIFQFGFALFMQGHMSEIAREVSRRVAVGASAASEFAYAGGLIRIRTTSASRSKSVRVQA